MHTLDNDAHTQQARYDVDLGDGTVKSRYALQRTRENSWVNLGVMELNGTPSISLMHGADLMRKRLYITCRDCQHWIEQSRRLDSLRLCR